MRGLKILIIEDDLIMAEDLKEELKGLGYLVTNIARNAIDALAAFDKDIPDLVLCDIDLQGSKQDGIQIARDFNERARVPIIFLSGHYEEALIQRAQEVKHANYLVKPHNTPQLKVAITKAIMEWTEHSDNNEGIGSAKNLDEGIAYSMGNDSFFIKQDSRWVRIFFKDVAYVQSAKAKVHIYVYGEDAPKYYEFSVNLASFQRKVSHPTLLRIHKSFAVNLEKIKSYTTNGVLLFPPYNMRSISFGPVYRDAFLAAMPWLKAD